MREKTADGHQVIIATTAHAIKGDAERCLAAGMDAYASKPIHAAELLAAISCADARAGTDDELKRGAQKRTGAPRK
jgi:CheY-like chemotaxis protein